MDERGFITLEDFDALEAYWDRVRAERIAEGQRESARANLLLTAIMAASAATLEPPPGTVIIRSPKRVVDAGSAFSRQSRTNRCENCAGKRSPEANYCPRCGHRRQRA
jgi:hypothetical protein